MTFPVRNSMAPRQKGFTLIEVLVAFLILSVGLLGVVALMVQAKVSQHQAVQRTRAVELANEMVERIRINPAGVVGNVGDTGTYNIGLNPINIGTSGPSPNCTTSPCDEKQLADHDLWLWEQALQGQATTIDGEAADGLIEPRGCIVFEPADVTDPSRGAIGQLSVIVQWRGLAETSDALQAGDPVCGGESIGHDPYRRHVAVNTYTYAIIEEEL